MIKRRFYKLEHGDGDSGSDSSSFSSDSELEEEEASVEPEDESEDDAVAELSQDDSVGELDENDESCSTSSGLINDDDDGDDEGNFKDAESAVATKLFHKHGLRPVETKSNATDEEEQAQDIPACIMKCKSVFKCRFCPSIICLNEETMRAHVNSKRHARSEKLRKEGKLKAILNSDGEIEEQEIAEEMYAPDTAPAQDKSKKKSKGSRRQRKGSKRREKKSIKHGASEAVHQRPAKKSRKIKD